jgi:uncharacterized DUF497 family protein
MDESEINFEWDENKRRENYDKHGVDFKHAIMIFAGLVVEEEDTRKNYDETRYQVIGEIEDEYFVVVYTWRTKNRRIISAWKAGRNARRKYQTVYAEAN